VTRLQIYEDHIAERVMEQRVPGGPALPWVAGASRLDVYPVNIPTDISELFLRFAFEAARAMPHYSARAIIHRIRWYAVIERHDPHFYINSEVSPHLSRWAMWKAPKLGAPRSDGHPFFMVRKARADTLPYRGPTRGKTAEELYGLRGRGPEA
jgi:hypothetical protein